jgi:hypothetical protein
MVAKIILAVILVSVCSGLCLFWNSGVQPNVATDQSMRQLEIHTDGTGDRLAEQRRLVTGVYHWPTDAACVITGLLLIVMFYPDVKKLVKKAKEEVSKV